MAEVKRNYTKWTGWLINPDKVEKESIEVPITQPFNVTAPTPFAARREIFKAYCLERHLDYTLYRTEIFKYIRIKNLADERTTLKPDDLTSQLIHSLSGGRSNGTLSY